MWSVRGCPQIAARPRRSGNASSLPRQRQPVARASQATIPADQGRFQNIETYHTAPDSRQVFSTKPAVMLRVCACSATMCLPCLRGARVGQVVGVSAIKAPLECGSLPRPHPLRGSCPAHLLPHRHGPGESTPWLAFIACRQRENPPQKARSRCPKKLPHSLRPFASRGDPDSGMPLRSQANQSAIDRFRTRGGRVESGRVEKLRRLSSLPQGQTERGSLGTTVRGGPARPGLDLGQWPAARCAARPPNRAWRR